MLDEFQKAPAWSIYTGDVGRTLVIVAVALFAISALAWFLGAKNKPLARVGAVTFTLGCVGLIGSFAILGTLFANNRFEYDYIWKHADSSNTLPYRVAGMWSGQEGSFLLWAVAAAIFALVIVRLTEHYRRWFTIINALFLGSICGILAYESPFDLIRVAGQVIVPNEGQGLSPSLQNYWVVIHPPTIFLGFGSLTALFALAFAATLQKDYDRWIPIVRPWALVSMSLVGLGLCMGGFWAYETLGWGGFWMWDPVENVSFVPWCLTAAFVHGIIVQTTRNRWKLPNLMFGALPFLAFIYGTFLTRSGFLADASVHSFAEMDRSALRLLVGLMAVMTFGFLGAWIVRRFQDRPEEEPAAKAWNKEGFYKIGAMLLIGLGMSALIGMSVPLVQALSGKKPSVIEEHAYHLVIPWLFIPLMIVMALAPFASWKGSSFKDLGKVAYTLICVVIGLTGLMLLGMALSPLGHLADLTSYVTFPKGIHVSSLSWVMFLVGICLFAILGNLWRMASTMKGTKLGLAPLLTHIGVAVLMIGLIVSRGFERKEQTFVMQEMPGHASGYIIRYEGMTSKMSDRDNKVKFGFYDEKNPSHLLFVSTPGLYQVPKGEMAGNTMVWPSIQRSPLYDVYVAIQPPQTHGGTSVHMMPGETQDVGGIPITYLGMVMEGEPGQPGTKFGAKLKVQGTTSSKIITPMMELGGEQGMIQHPAELDEATRISMLGMNAADKSVTLQLELMTPIYPMEVFHKPFTSLVWGGCGIMTLGGLLSAYYRRKVKVAAREAVRTQPVKEKIPAIA